MAKDWSVNKEGDNLVYTLKMEGGRGVLEVKEKASRNGGTSWAVYHDKVELTSGWADIQHSLDYCNNIAEKLS